MKEEVTRIFDEHLTKTLGQKPEILNYLLKHERKKIAIESCCYQIGLAELGSVKLDAVRRQKLVESVARMFGKVALEWKEQQIISEAEKRRRIQQADSLKEAEGSIHELEEEAKSEKIKVFQTR